MAKRTDSELLQAIGDALPDATTDEAIALLTDVRDTLSGNANSAQIERDYQQRIDELDSSWRKKFKETFYAPVAESRGGKGEEKDKPKTRYEDLFKEEN